VIARAVAALSADGAHDRAFTLHRQWLESRTHALDAQASLQAARLAVAAGNFAECARFANEALARGQSSEDARLVGEAALVLGTNLRPAIVDRQLVRALEDALARLSRDPQADPALRCRVRARLSAALQPAIDFNVPVAMARIAIEEARALADPLLIRDVLFVAGSTLTSSVPPLETCEMASELFERARASDDVPLMLRAQVRRIMHRIELGKLEVFGKEIDDLLLLAESVGLPALMWRPLLVGSLRALAQGNFAESERLLGEVEELGKLTDDPALSFGLLAHTGMRATLVEDEAGIRASREAYAHMLPQTGPQPGIRAQLMAYVALRLGERAAAARELDELMRIVSASPDAFLPAVAGEVAALTGSAEQCRVVHGVLEPLRDEWLVSSQVDFAFGGPIERVLGLLESALGEHDQAIESFAHAREQCARHGLRPWMARIDLELGRVQLAAGRPADARTTLARALEIADALPVPLTAQRVRNELQTLQAAGSTAPPPATASTPDAASQPKSQVLLTQQGDVWRARYADREVLLKDSRGIQLLARLITSPGERVHALALSSDEGAALGESSAGAALDVTALKRYRTRLAELDDEIATAESMDDAARAERLHAEREALTAELRRAVGLGGRLRKVGSVTERARVNVTRRVREAIARVAEAHPELGRYLTDAIRTGTYCSFRP
jgi:tetratricopeptide (TPR) repeat protein